MSRHKDLTGPEIHIPFNYWQETDPGAVGAKLTWYKESTKSLTYRNSSNSAWNPVLSSPVISLPIGTTWTQLRAAISAAADGSTILVPNEKIIQTNGVTFGSKNLTISGSGPFSELQADRDISQGGSGNQFFFRDSTGGAASTVTFRNLIISQDRANVGRMAMFRLQGPWTGTLNFDQLTLNDCTANIFEQVGSQCHVINIRGCTANEWYEGFYFGPSVSGVDQLTVADCVGTVTNGSPSGGTSRPQFMLLSNEFATTPSANANVFILNNRFVGDFSASNDILQSTGIAIKNGTNGAQVYQHVYMSGNHIEGFHDNEIQLYHTNGGGSGGAEGRCLITYHKNKFISDNSVRTFWIRLSAGTVFLKDRIFFGDNDLCKSSGAGNLVVEDTGGLAATILRLEDPPNKYYQFPFPTMVADITESFTTGDGDTLGPDQTWTEVVGDFDIVSNHAQLITRGTESRARCETSTGGADHYVSCMMDQDFAASVALSKTKIGLIARWDAADTNYYQAWIDFKFRRVVLTNKAGLQIGAVRVESLGLRDTDTTFFPVKLGLRCKSTLITVFLDDVSVLVEVDDSVTTGNFTGIMGFDTLDAGTRVLAYSEFEAGNV